MYGSSFGVALVLTHYKK